MPLTSNNNKKSGKTSPCSSSHQLRQPTNTTTNSVSVDEKHNHDPIKHQHQQQQQEMQTGDRLIGLKHEKLINPRNTTTGESQKYLMSKKHFIKTNETSSISRPTTTTTTTTWLISPPTPTTTPPTKKSTVKINQGKFSESQAKKVQKSGTEKFYKVSVQNPDTGKMEINMSPVLITISPGESGAHDRDADNDLLGEKGTDLTRIMDNFISVTATNFSETGSGMEDESLASSGKLQILTSSKMDPVGCVDFGIADYLCDFKHDEDEIEVDISSDTDSNFIAATPPNRFSDSDFEGIEPISITLETSLNPSQVSQAIIHKIESQQQQLDKWGKPVTPRRPFRRHISLPPSLFMSRFFGNNKDNSPLLSPNKEFAFIFKSTSGLGFPTTKGGPFHLPRINRLESISSSDMECTHSHSYSTESSSMKCQYTKSNSSWSMSIESGGSEFEEQESAFTSEIEKKALLVRSMRRLVRQDTTVGNFAPPDYRNT